MKFITANLYIYFSYMSMHIFNIPGLTQNTRCFLFLFLLLFFLFIVCLFGNM